MGVKKRLFWWSTGLLLCGCLTVSGYAETLERTVAVVNGDIILYGDVLEQLKLQEKLHAAVNLQSPEEKSRLEREMLQSMIRQRLAEQEVKRLKIVVTKGEVDSALADILQKNGGLTEAQFDAALAREGTNAKQFREKLKKEIERAKLMERAVKSKIVITEAQIDARMNDRTTCTHPAYPSGPTDCQHKPYAPRRCCRQATPGDDLPARSQGARADTVSQTEKQARKIHGKLKDGGDFAKLAREHSHGPGAADGGDIGYVGADELAPEIEKGIHSLSVGAVSEVIKTSSGFYILKILEARSERHRQRRRRPRRNRRRKHSYSLEKQSAGSCLWKSLAASTKSGSGTSKRKPSSRLPCDPCNGCRAWSGLAEESGSMKDLGEFLKTERLRQGVELATITEQTCISRSMLIALEEGDASKIGTPLLVRSFTRAYCRILRIDPSAVLERYTGEIPRHERLDDGIRRFRESSQAARHRGRLRLIMVTMALITLGAVYYTTVSLPRRDAATVQLNPGLADSDQGMADVAAPIDVVAPSEEEIGPGPNPTVAGPSWGGTTNSWRGWWLFRPR